MMFFYSFRKIFKRFYFVEVFLIGWPINKILAYSTSFNGWQYLNIKVTNSFIVKSWSAKYSSYFSNFHSYRWLIRHLKFQGIILSSSLGQTFITFAASEIFKIFHRYFRINSSYLIFKIFLNHLKQLFSGILELKEDFVDRSFSKEFI